MSDVELTDAERVDPRNDPTIRAAWDEWNRNTPESFWDVAVLPRRQASGIEPSIMWPVSLDVANRFEIWAHGFAAAKARCAELEKGWKVRADAVIEYRAENAALQARLDRVKALVAQTKHKTTDHEGTVTAYLLPAAEMDAALADSGTKDGSNDA